MATSEKTSEIHVNKETDLRGDLVPKDSAAAEKARSLIQLQSRNDDLLEAMASHQTRAANDDGSFRKKLHDALSSEFGSVASEKRYPISSEADRLHQQGTTPVSFLERELARARVKDSEELSTMASELEQTFADVQSGLDKVVLDIQAKEKRMKDSAP